MGLIKCQDCGKMISDLSEQCFNCGRPIQVGDVSGQSDSSYDPTGLKSNSDTTKLLCFILSVTFFILLFKNTVGSSSANSGSNYQQAEVSDSGSFRESSSRKAAKWYEGGNLHQKTLREWVHATSENKLATCGDFAVSHPNIKKMVEGQSSVDSVLPYAVQLVAGIDEVAKEQGAWNQKVSDTAVALMILMKW